MRTFSAFFFFFLRDRGRGWGEEETTDGKSPLENFVSGFLSSTFGFQGGRIVSVC